MRKLVIIVLFYPLLLAAKGPTRFDMRDGGMRNVVQFVSEALLEKIIGISSAVSGWIEVDLDRVAESLRGEFEVDVRTFETGIELRNEHIREKYLGASEYPVASFVVQRVLSTSKSKLVASQPVIVRLEGNLKARGLIKTQTVLLKLTYLPESESTKQRLPGNLLKASLTFDVDVAGFNVQVPENMKNRFANFIQVSLDAMGTDRPPSTIPLPEGPKPKEREKKSS